MIITTDQAATITDIATITDLLNKGANTEQMTADYRNARKELTATLPAAIRTAAPLADGYRAAAAWCAAQTITD